MPRRRNPLVQNAIVWTSLAFVGLMDRLPLSWARSVAVFLGNLAYFAVPRIRKVGLANLDLAYGDTLSSSEKRHILRGAVRNVALTAAEFSRMPRLFQAGFERYVDIEGKEHFETGKGALCIGGHLGNWEWMAPAMSSTGRPVAEVVRPFDDPRLNRVIDTTRRGGGAETIPKDDAGREIIRRLKEGSLVGGACRSKPTPQRGAGDLFRGALLGDDCSRHDRGPFQGSHPSGRHGAGAGFPATPSRSIRRSNSNTAAICARIWCGTRNGARTPSSRLSGSFPASGSGSTAAGSRATTSKRNGRKSSPRTPNRDAKKRGLDFPPSVVSTWVGLWTQGFSRGYAGEAPPTVPVAEMEEPMNHFLLLASIAGSMLFSLHAQCDSPPPYPEGLHCEGQENPLAVETATPLLQWHLVCDSRNAVQAAFQVQVAAGEDALLGNGPLLWDSGKMLSSAQSVRYEGPAPAAASQVFWQVRVWDDSDRPSDWSETASWTLGLSPEDWRAQWIAGGEAPPRFRKDFAVAGKKVRRAVAFVCGLGHFELSVNGRKAGDHVLDPGWTNYRKTCLYVPFDVTAMLRPGENTLGVMLGNGMYNVPGGRYVKFTGSFGEPKLILQLHLEYEDGTKEVVASGGDWQTSEGPIRFSCVYGGEDYDARLEEPGWDEPGFQSAAWSPARVVDGPGGTLQAQTAPPLKVIRTYEAKTIQPSAPGKYEADLGLNLSARPWIRIQGPAGAQVTIETAERKDTPWADHSYTYTLKGEGEETFRPRFTYFGFQYLYLTGVDWGADADGTSGRPVLLAAGGDFISSSATPVGGFECNYPLFNDIHAMIDRSVRSNLQSVLTDCPHREKLGWLEVSHLMGPSIFYQYDVQQLYRKICQDTTEAQLENGMIPDIAPEYTRFQGGFFESAEWGSAAVQIPWLLYQWYGDEDILARQFDTMAAYTRYLSSTRNDAGLAKGGLGDWYDWTPERGHVGASQLTPPELPATCMLFDNARILSRVAEMLGKTDEAQEFAALTKAVRADFLRAYYDPAAKSVSTGSQAALAMALYFGLVPEEDCSAVLARLVRDLKACGYKQSTGEVAFRYLVQALVQAGRSDVVYRMVDRTDAPGYGCMLTQWGLKTLSERWDKPGSSLNHCMFGHIQEWFQGGLLGIQQAPGSVGFERLRIVPLPIGNITQAQGYYDSRRGRIAVAWEKADDTFTLKVTIPPNTTAEIILPGNEKSAVTESGQSIPQDSLTYDALGLHLQTGSGEYRFQTKKET